MSSERWKLEKDLCRCCHSEGRFKNLAEPAQSGGLAEAYADMLNDCFDIDMSPVPGLLTAYTICEICIIRLRDASEFKKQVLTCEERFKDLYSKNPIGATTTLVVEVKQELVDVAEEPRGLFFKQEIPQDDDDDDEYSDALHICEDEIEESKEEETAQPVKVEATKKRKCKTKKTVKRKPTKKTKRKNAKVNSADNAGEENDAEKNDDEKNDAVKKQGRGGKPKYYVKEGEDYKKVGDVYHCTRCDSKYSSSVTVKYHVRCKHFKMKKYKCSICIEGFITEGPLTTHKLKVHNVDDRLQCNECEKLFNTKQHLVLHINGCHMGKKHKCEKCNYESHSSENVRKHRFVHATVRAYHCRFCKKSFKNGTTLAQHEKIHTGNRNKVCTICGTAFVQKASLNFHMTKYHPGAKF